MNYQKKSRTFYTHKEFSAGELGECLESGWKIKKTHKGEIILVAHRRGVNAQDGGSLVVLSIRS
jgi:hypothetical protein